MSERINGTNGFQRAPGLPRSERPQLWMYLVRRKSDGMHFQVEAMHWGGREVCMFDYKDPQAQPILESFDNVEFVDKRPEPGRGPEIFVDGRS